MGVFDEWDSEVLPPEKFGLDVRNELNDRAVLVNPENARQGQRQSLVASTKDLDERKAAILTRIATKGLQLCADLNRAEAIRANDGLLKWRQHQANRPGSVGDEMVSYFQAVLDTYHFWYIEHGIPFPVKETESPAAEPSTPSDLREQREMIDAYITAVETFNESELSLRKLYDSSKVSNATWSRRFTEVQFVLRLKGELMKKKNYAKTKAKKQFWRDAIEVIDRKMVGLSNSLYRSRERSVGRSIEDFEDPTNSPETDE